MKKFKSERVWMRHVFSDLRAYLCTFPDCDVPYFSDVNEWFRHEMENHRVSFSCRLCRSKPFSLRERYVTHVQKYHPSALEDGNEELILSIAREPIEQIPAQDCPCCSDWIDRLKTRIETPGTPSSAPEQVLCVTPAVFKRHLASHLEQLASFAIPIASPAEGDGDSNAVIEDNENLHSRASDLSALAFESPPRTPDTRGHPASEFGTVDTTISLPAWPPPEVVDYSEQESAFASLGETLIVEDAQMVDVEDSGNIARSDPTLDVSDSIRLIDIDPKDVPDHLKKVDPDGTWFAVFNPDVPRMFDIELVGNLEGMGIVCCIRFSRDGKYIAASSDGCATIFDTNTGLRVTQFRIPIPAESEHCYVRCLCFSPDGKWLATGSEDEIIRVSNLFTGLPALLRYETYHRSSCGKSNLGSSFAYLMGTLEIYILLTIPRMGSTSRQPAAIRRYACGTFLSIGAIGHAP